MSIQENFFKRNQTTACNKAKEMGDSFYKKYIVPDLKNRYEDDWKKYDSVEYYDYYDISTSMIPDFVDGKPYSEKDIIFAIAGIVLAPNKVSEYLSVEGLAYVLSNRGELVANKNQKEKDDLCLLVSELEKLIEEKDSINGEIKENVLIFLEEFKDLANSSIPA